MPVVEINSRRRTRSPQPPSTPTEVWPIVIKLLHKPTWNKKHEKIHELALRQPTARDIRRYGNPVLINSNGDVIVDAKKMTRMIEALSGVTPPFIDMLDSRDWTSCSFFLQQFFLPDHHSWS